MSALSFKNFLTFVDMDEPTEEQLCELFGFGKDKKKVDALKAKNAELRAKRDGIKADAGPSARNRQADDRGAENKWVDDKIPVRQAAGTDPRKTYTNKKTWRDAVDQLGAKAAENTSTFAKDAKGNIIAKWNEDKREGWIELREGTNGGAQYSGYDKLLGHMTKKGNTYHGDEGVKVTIDKHGTWKLQKGSDEFTGTTALGLKKHLTEGKDEDHDEYTQGYEYAKWCRRKNKQISADEMSKMTAAYKQGVRKGLNESNV